ncbi:hypothetical protein [Nibricoccus aquaticus]|uniref:hypothetical protein n=1 Tax=Nibricoccus aquaticus TaxID=2576891 RepID=UPI0010FE1B85|nr:hypothetical protein [Nibricoccus aquaticus]
MAATFWMLMTAALLSSTELRAEDDEEKSTLSPAQQELSRKFAGIASWEGRFTYESYGVESGGDWNKYTYTQEGATSGTFRLEADREGSFPERGVIVWKGDGKAAGSLRYRDSTWNPRGFGSEEGMDVSGTWPMRGIELTLWIDKSHAFLHSGIIEEKDYVQTRITGRAVGEVNLSSSKYETRYTTIDRATTFHPITWGTLSDEPGIWGPFRGGPGVVVYNYEQKGGYAWGRAASRSKTQVIMYPVYDDLEVEIEASGYDTWRPEGSIAQTDKSGNGLAFRARLVRKSGSGKSIPDVKKFRFELVGTSREPGVCLNWPVGARDSEYDLKLTAAPGFRTAQPFTGVGAKISDQGQKGELKNPPRDDKGSPYADIAVESYDFGGRSELLVVCELEDGRELIGKLKGAADPAVRLPKRAAGDWVAQSWRDAHGVKALSAGDDEEKVAGQPLNGDGFTLYEEYRGWAIGGKHYEGDPKRKDFFVRNYIGRPAEAGIALFSSVTQIRVQHRQTDQEFNLSRVMNLNHRDAPHRVDQHCVVMFNAEGTGSSGGRTHAIKGVGAGQRWRPKDVQNITVEMPGVTDGIFSAGRSVGRYNLSDADARQAYARGIAHELLHAVGVEHHGEGEDVNEFYFQAASDPNNPTHHVRFCTRSPFISDFDLRLPSSGKPYSLDRGRTITLLWEDTGRDIAEEMAPAFERALAAERAHRAAHPPSADAGERASRFSHYGKSAEYWRESAVYDDVARGMTEAGFEAFREKGKFPGFSRSVTIGKLGQADSGHESCLMRYYFANAYPVAGKTDTYYVVRGGQNHVGNLLCQSPVGTGANDAGHQPQPRFGDASGGNGNCLSQVCPNDAIPPH